MILLSYFIVKTVRTMYFVLILSKARFSKLLFHPTTLGYLYRNLYRTTLVIITRYPFQDILYTLLNIQFN